MDMSSEIHSGEIACSLLSDHDFLLQWQQLYARCPWSTPFQTPPFVTTWFQCYGDLYPPPIVTQRNSSGQLQVLWVLAQCETTHQLYVAGTHHAEYQAWLSAEQDCAPFFVASMQLLDQHYPQHSLTFKIPATRISARQTPTKYGTEPMSGK